MSWPASASAYPVALAACRRDRLGGLDCLVNNAAIYAGLARKNFETITEAE